MDLGQDLFRVTLADTNAPLKEDLFEAIRKLSYTPTLEKDVTFATGSKSSPLGGGVPPIIQSALDQAKVESKQFVLVKGTGDN